jgi:hypothetical protein
MGLYSTGWTQLSNIGEALKTAGYFDAFYAGGPKVIPDAQKKVLVLEVQSEDDENAGIRNGWQGEYQFFVMKSDPRAGGDQIIGTTADPGLEILVTQTRETLSSNLKDFDPIDHYELGPTNYGTRKSHPNRVAFFTVTLKSYLNPVNRQSSGSATVLVPALQAQNLDDLGDVTLTAAANGQVLKYNGSAWVNGTDDAGTTISSIDDIADVVVTTPADNSVLAWDSSSSKWIDQTASEAGLSASSHQHSLDDLSDVDLTGAVEGALLQKSGSGWVDSAVTVVSAESPLNIPILGVAPASPSAGDLYLLLDGSTYKLCLWTGSATKTLSFA